MRTLYEWLSLLIQLLSVVIVILVLILTLRGAEKISDLEIHDEVQTAVIQDNIVRLEVLEKISLTQSKENENE